MLTKVLGASLIKSAVTHVVDQLKDTVKEPKVGSILYTGLIGDFMEHSGVYIGNGKIIELNNKGHIVEVTPSEFVDGGTGINIYVSSKNGFPVGSSLIAERAIKYEREVSVKDYNILLDNCHMFTSACITGELENSNSFLWMVKDLAKSSLNADDWLVWDGAENFVINPSSNVEYSHDDLEKVQKHLKEVKKQSKGQWEEIISHTKLVRKHHDNAPWRSIFCTEAKQERWDKKLAELEEIEKVMNRKHDDLLAEQSALENKIEEIQQSLNQ
ncbi:C40 family peptidase [Psychrosphaera aestuarii]|uniref:hypothetical protein n=1 Tax=Psychrosphaera aestuarii TaxID=1266052 RepID=UPI001B329FB3|nr:hypothetical protein [Psychrosphaera aestuarii]